MIELRLLGAVDLRDERGATMEAALRGSKRMAVLAYVAAATPRGFHRRDKLAALFWPDLSEDRARGSLRTTLARLREDLGNEIFLTRGASEVSLNPKRVLCDVVSLDQCIREGRLLEAAELYRGDLLDGVHVEGAGEALESWIAAERDRLRAVFIAAVVSATTREEADAPMPDRLRLLRRARSIAPSDETVARAFISTLVASGDRGSALVAFTEFADQLARDLQVEPSAETRRLAEGIREMDTTVGRKPGGTSSPRTADSPGPIERSRQASGAESIDAPVRPTATRHVLRYAWVLLGVLALAATVRYRSFSASTPAATAEVARWEKLSGFLGTQPAARTYPEVLLDSTEDAIVLMMGTATGVSTDTTIFRDVWRLHGLRPGEAPAWTRLVVAPGAAPAARWAFQLGYDASHDIAIIHGGALGHTSPCANDTWILEHTSGIGAQPRWRQVRTPGYVPQPHGNVMGAYDPATRRLIVFGGHDCFNTYFSDVWVLAFDDSTLASGHWQRLSPDSSGGDPARRVGALAMYDPRGNRLFVHGGNTSGNVVSELWALEHANGLGGQSSWHLVHCRGVPPILESSSGAFDAATGSIVMFTGQDLQSVANNSVWRVSGLADGGSRCAWERLAGSDPSPMARHTARVAVDPTSKSVILLGGVIDGVPLMDAWRLQTTIQEIRRP